MPDDLVLRDTHQRDHQLPSPPQPINNPSLKRPARVFPRKSSQMHPPDPRDITRNFITNFHTPSLQIERREAQDFDRGTQRL